MKKLVFLVIILMLLMACSSEVSNYKFVTGDPGGTYYPLGSSISELLTNHSEHFDVSAYVGNASVSNTKMISNGEADMALVQSNVAYWADMGHEMFDEPIDNIRGIAALYPETIHIVVRADSDIENIEDLRRKNISIGEEGSGNYFDALNILEAYGIKNTDYIQLKFQWNDANQGMINGSVDAIFMTSGVPTSSLNALASEVEIRLIPIDQEIIDRLLEEKPYYKAGLVPAGTYVGVDQDIPTLTMKALWVCNEQLDEEDVYEMTSLFWENFKDVTDINFSTQKIKMEEALAGMSIQLHSGAMRYYEEQDIEMD